MIELYSLVRYSGKYEVCHKGLYKVTFVHIGGYFDLELQGYYGPYDVPYRTLLSVELKDLKLEE